MKSTARQALIPAGLIFFKEGIATPDVWLSLAKPEMVRVRTRFQDFRLRFSIGSFAMAGRISKDGVPVYVHGRRNEAKEKKIISLLRGLDETPQANTHPILS